MSDEQRMTSFRKRDLELKLRDHFDPVAVEIVSLIADRLHNGKLYAYDGIEAAREIRDRIAAEVVATNLVK